MKLFSPLTALFLLASTGSAQTFHLKDLGTLGGKTSIAAGINASGQIVGSAALASGDMHAFLFTGGVMKDLGTFGGTKSEAAAINASGEVVGDAYTANNAHQRAFKYTGGSIQDLGTLGGTYAQAFGLNSSGQIVGMSNTADGHYRAFLYTGGPLQNLGTLGGDFSYALGINDAGLIVGDANTSVEMEHGFLYSGSMMTDLGTLPNATVGSTAFAINSSGQIGGYSYTSSGAGEAFLITGGNMRDLGALPGHGSLTHGVNANGIVVGSSEFDFSKGSHGFYWANGVITDLNSMLDSSGSGWTIQDGAGINDNGWIAATALNASGQAHVVLLTPALAVKSFTLSPTSVIGGLSSTGKVILTGSAPNGGTVVTLSGGDGFVSYPTMVTVPAGNNSVIFKISTAPVSSADTEKLTATVGSSSQNADLTINTANMSYISIVPTSVVGGYAASCYVWLTNNAGPSGDSVTLSGGGSGIGFPSKILIPAGTNEKTFYVTTAPVSATISVSITAAYGTTSKTTSFTVRTANVAMVTFSPASVTGGSSSNATVTLSFKAGPTGDVITLSGGDSSISYPSTVKVAAGATTVTFTVKTLKVTAIKTESITATLGSSSATGKLTLNP